MTLENVPGTEAEAVKDRDTSCKFWKTRRYVVVLMTLLGFLGCYSIRVCLSVAIVAMTEKFNRTLENGTIIEDQHFDWNSKEQGLILSSFFYGYVFTQVLGGVLASKFGGYYIFVSGVGGSSLMALLIPVAASFSIYMLMAVRILEGLFEGVTFPAMHALLSRWAPVCERSRMVSLCILGCHGGTVIAMPLSGFLAASLGWKSVFYFYGCLGAFWCIVWFLLIRTSPENDGFISKEESLYIARSLGNKNGPKEKITHPWKMILTSTAVWAIVISHIAGNFGFTVFLTQMPTFFADILEFNVQDSGIISAIPYLSMSCFLVIGGYLADWLQIKGYLNTTQVRKYSTCGALLAQCAFILVAAFIVSPSGIITCLTLTVGFAGLANVGYIINPLDLAPQHASVIMGISNTIANIPGLLSPFVVGLIVTDKSKEQWQIVFFIVVGINVAGCLFYWFFAKGELQPWAISAPTDPAKSVNVNNTKKTSIAGKTL